MRPVCYKVFIVCCVFLLSSQNSEAQLFGRLKSRLCPSRSSSCSCTPAAVATCYAAKSTCLMEYNENIARCERLLGHNPEALAICKNAAVKKYCECFCTPHSRRGAVMGDAPTDPPTLAEACVDAYTQCVAAEGIGNCEDLFFRCLKEIEENSPIP